MTLCTSPPRVLFTGAAISVGRNEQFDWSRNEAFFVRLRFNKAGTYMYCSPEVRPLIVPFSFSLPSQLGDRFSKVWVRMKAKISIKENGVIR